MNPDESMAQKKYPTEHTLEPKENFWKEIFKFVVIALIIIVPIRAYVAEPFIVSGASMDPTFATGQYLVVDQLSYHFENPQRGDVIIFKYPLDTSVYFIKRIIGLPGETVYINNGVVTIYPPARDDTNNTNDTQNTISTSSPSKGITLSEPYIAPEHRSFDTSTITLGPTQYFVMGDNRNQSSDSRIWGPVDRSLIVGRPIVRLLPPSTFAIFPGRDTQEETQ